MITALDHDVIKKLCCFDWKNAKDPQKELK